MDDLSAEDFDDAERTRIVNEARALAAQTVIPPSRKPLGCPIIISTIAVLVFLPRLIPRAWLPLVFILSGVLILAGLFFLLFGSSRQWSALLEHTSDALAALASRWNELSPDERRSAAIKALYFAHFSDGPTTSMTYDPEQHRPNLGKALPYLEAVERVLVKEGMIYPVFTGQAASGSEP